MSELSIARKSSDLAIIERKSHFHRPAGCVGIFFQLFDWNRRFSKKKLFPKKLLPPARTKVSKKFNAEEKLPLTKHLLIADENSGGFPSKTTKNKNGDYKSGLESKKHKMQSPGLVARLMGLEAMPVVSDESNKNPSKDNKSGDLKNMELSPEKANVRPQKLQKTGISERRPVTRFGVEALQIKNVLCRSRKQNYHHPNLVSPVKSPKTGRNGSRLIDVATRILEPGIQASHRARCSLSYPSSSMIEARKEEVNQSSEEHGCRNCGNVFGRVDLNLTSVADESKPRPVVYLKNENDVVLLKSRSNSSQSEGNRPVRGELIWNEMRPSQHYDEIPVNRIFTSQKDSSRSTGYNSRSQRPGKMLDGDRVGRVPPKPKSVNPHGRRVSSPPVNEAKDFVALNRNIGRPRVKALNKPESSFQGDRVFQTGKDDSLGSQRLPVRKRRNLVNNNRNLVNDSSALASLSFEKRSSPKTRLSSQRGNKDVIRTDVVSFTFNSPVKSNPGRKFHNEDGVKRKNLICPVDEVRGTEESSRKCSGMDDDALGVLLEQKLKELTNQVENESVTGFKPSARTTASILQELISALTKDQPIPPEGREYMLDRNDSECNDIFDRISKANSRSKRSSDGISRGVDHFSPGCVLDASFSNESCVSSSSDDNSEKLAADEAILSDSASSTNNAQKSDIMGVTDLVTHTSAVLEDINCVHAKLTATKRDYMKEIILNTELLFGNSGGLNSSSRFLDFLLGSFLEELETLIIAAWKNSIILGIEVKKEESPLRKFLIDCLIECLDGKYSKYISSGFRTFCRLPKSINADFLIKEFDEEVRKWISFAGKSLDEIIEKDMSSCFGKWTDFELEVFENGVEINQDIVQSLVDDIVTDLCNSELCF